MSTGNFYDEDDWNGEEYDYTDLADDDLYDDELESWECAYPGQCLMAYTDHMRSECHTVEDMEAYYREMQEQEQSA